MDILISTSFGLVVDACGHYFAQVISDKEDEGGQRNDVYFPLPAKEAKRLSLLLNVEIYEERSTISLYNTDVVGQLRKEAIQ